MKTTLRRSSPLTARPSLHVIRTDPKQCRRNAPWTGDASNRPHTLAPTIVLGATDEMRIMQEEIFGPVLPILTYHQID